MKIKLKHKFRFYIVCILCIFILLYFFFKVKKENFQSFLQKQIDIRSLKSRLKSFSKSNGVNKCLTEIDCYNKLIHSLYDDFFGELLKLANPDAILIGTFGDDNKSGVIKLINEIKNNKDITKKMIESVNETNLSILLELADKLTKISDNVSEYKKDLLYKYELVISDIMPKNLIQFNSNDFISKHYEDSTPSTTVNYNSLMLATKEKNKNKQKKSPDINSKSYQEQKITTIKDFFFIDFKDFFETTKIVSVKTIAKIRLFNLNKFEEQLNSIFESYKDVDKVNSKIQKIKKELDKISSDTENWYCQNKNICVNS